METGISFLVVWLLIGSLTATGTALAPQGVPSKHEVTPGSYAHTRFLALDETTLANGPVLKTPEPGTIADFYGPFDEKPGRQDRDKSQRDNLGGIWQQEYGD